MKKTDVIPSRVPVGAGRHMSKSIIVHHNKKSNIIKSFGRYNDIMSHENFEQDYEINKNIDGPNAVQEKVHELYKLDDSYDSTVVPARVQNQNNKNGLGNKQHASAATSAGQTAATSNQNNNYFASRHFVDSSGFEQKIRGNAN